MLVLASHPKVEFAHVNTCGLVKVKNSRMRVGFPGLSDITGMLKNGKYFAIEVKTEIGKISEQQQWFIDIVNKNNGIAGIARNVDDVVELLK